MPEDPNITKQKAALKKREDAAYASIKQAEDELFALEDRLERRGERLSVEGQ